MPASNWFWIIYVICTLFGGFVGFTTDCNRRWIGGGVVVFVLVGLLGWGIFGSPLK